MQQQHLVPAKDFCRYHNIEISFLQSLDSYGLIHVTRMEENIFLDPDDLGDIEKMIRLHEDLQINLEGIDAITQLLKRMEKLQEEIMQMRNRLRMFES